MVCWCKWSAGANGLLVLRICADSDLRGNTAVGLPHFSGDWRRFALANETVPKESTMRFGMDVWLCFRHPTEGFCLNIPCIHAWPIFCNYEQKDNLLPYNKA